MRRRFLREKIGRDARTADEPDPKIGAIDIPDPALAVVPPRHVTGLIARSLKQIQICAWPVGS